MKKQLNSSVKAHLLQGAFYLILLVAVCVIPFALGQRATTKQSAGPLLLGSGPLATLSTGDDPTSGTWTLTGSLNTARYYHTATLLPNGMVLVAGGDDSLNHLDSAELYDPASGTWTVTGSLNTARFFHTATLLPNGMVLVAAGENSSFSADASAELYTPGPIPTPTPTPRATPRPRPTPHPRPTPPFSPTPTATPIATPTPTPTVTPTPTPTATPQSLAAWERSFEKRQK
jgi:hypothetical protein